MAPIKRKGNAPEETATRQPQKRAKVGAEDRKIDSKPKDTAPKASELSVLRDDEPSFPRGGGSVLTPLERKQIQIQANKDVLFEQKGAKKSVRDFADDNDDDDDEDVEMEDADTGATAKKSRKKKSKGKKSTDKESAEKEGVRIEGLSYKVWAASKNTSMSSLADSSSVLYRDP
jgi:rRNA biogenesis protein RRP5